MKAIVIGGGIGGLTAALALLDQGIDVEVYEQAHELKEIGAGLQIAANASRVLTRLGLGPELERLGVAVHAIVMHDLHSDRPVHALPVERSDATPEAMTARFDGTFYQLHRPDLLGMLADAVPAGVTQLGERATGFVDDGAGVTVTFESGHRTRGDLLIGADGIHSRVRSQLLGETEPEFSRIVAWRALIPREKLAHLDLEQDCHVWLGPNRSGVAYWVHGGELLNFVGMVPADETAAESWTTQGDLAQMRRSFAGSNARLQAILDEIESPFITGYYYRYPLAEWARGRVALLGDAAHPMHPFLAQGACQAIEDAAVLAHTLASHLADGDVPAALAEYQTRRIPRAGRVQNASRTQEPVWHMSDPREIVQRNRTLASLSELDPDAKTLYGWVFSYDVEAEAAKPLRDPSAVLRREEARRAWTMWATLLRPKDLDRQHHGIREAYDRFLLHNFPPDPTVSIEDSPVDGRTHLRVTAPDGAGGPTLLHFHGGGYLLGSAAGSVGLASRLARETGGSVVVPDYRLAPEHPYPTAVEDAVASYDALLGRGVDPATVLISGESAGGGLAVALAMRLRDLGRPMPAGIVAMCPMGDLAVTGESVDTAAGVDPISTRTFLTQMATSYLQGSNPRAPLASPVYGDYQGLPPLLIQVGENEALYSDATRMADAARRDGVEVELDAYPDTVHVFQMFDFLPESSAALERTAKFAGRVTAPRP
ncbi:alpha/beta hydrolase fold domain-containing protein [Streptomyces sp. NPDC051985]|uniref:alpha/beta hydrolase fold domain-containing protein n=1 Tax=Streptomyces sp. NPDC051985 TaxID=3155807 RepID=UPI00342151EF